MRYNIPSISIVVNKYFFKCDVYNKNDNFIVTLNDEVNLDMYAMSKNK